MHIDLSDPNRKMLKKALGKYWNEKPLQAIMLLAIVVRILAAFFAKGYMMHDDHFLTIEPSSSWAVGQNFNNWLPGVGNERQEPEPISFFYLGFLFVFFKMMHWLDMENPDTQMVVIRLIHAFYSMLVVYFGYRITDNISSTRNAKMVGLLLAFIAIIPNFSVRNLVEMVCIPPLLFGFWLLIKNRTSLAPTKYSTSVIVAAAFVMGLAVGIRYQTVLMVAGVGLVIFLEKQYMKAVLFGIVSFIAFFITQLDDVLLWGGKPFQHLFGYFAYNKSHAGAYPASPFAYLSLIAVFIFPPVSLFLLFGFFGSWRNHLLIFLPTLF